jgi:hypothetical protein
MSQERGPKEGETQCSFHVQRKSSLVNSTQLTVADVENRAHGGDFVRVEKIKKMTGDVGVPRNRSRMVIRHRFGLRSTRRQGFLSLSILCSWAIARLGQRLVMVVFGARRAILGAADSVLLHPPIFIRTSPCMMHITLPITLMNKISLARRWLRRPPKGEMPLDVLESLAVCVAVEQ